MWQIPILGASSAPRFTRKEARAANGLVIAGPVNLLAGPEGSKGAGGGPTIMELWNITALYVPVGSLAKVEGAAEGALLTTTLILRYGGDILWSQAVTNVPVAGRNVFQTMGESFNTPLEVRRGRTLTLELQLSANVTTEELEASLSVWPAGQPGEHGTVTYYSQLLTGERIL